MQRLAALLTLAACGSFDPAADDVADDGKADGAGGGAPYFATVRIDHGAGPAIGDGDLWPTCWSDDDHVYTAWGDGRGFGAGQPFVDIGVARLEGHPERGDLRGTNLAIGDAVGQVWSDPAHNRKPSGIACVDSDLYLAVQDLSLDFNVAPHATIARSRDKGRTWTWDRSAPMFPGGLFTTVFFLDAGKDGVAQDDGFLYAYGIDHNWRASYRAGVPDPTALYLARVPRDAIQDRTRWQFFAGIVDRKPTWTAAISARVPVLEDARRLYTALAPGVDVGPVRDVTALSQGNVLRLPSGRFLYTSWTEYTFELYDAPAPWGPWQHLASQDFGVYPWSEGKHGGYAATVPSKFVARDGATMWLQSNTFSGGVTRYGFSLRRVELARARAGEPIATPGPRPTTTDGAVPIGRFHAGRAHVLGDGARTDQDDSWTGELRTVDHWGYTWPRAYRMNRVAFTSGDVFPAGGWFTDLAIEVRQDGEWIEVDALASSPAYPFGPSAGARTTYELRFAETWGDGVRIVGTPGGSARFTSIAELAVALD